MTAIALLNVYEEPHLISDSMLSRHTNQAPSTQTIWLPARGDIEAVQKVGTDGWRISAFVRKTVYLPNESGIFAWSGSHPQASIFWTNLQEKFLTNYHFDTAAKVSLSQLSKSYDEAVASIRAQREALDLHIVGYVIDGKAVIPFAFNNFVELKTINYGTCFLIGSGKDCIAECIKSKDAKPLKRSTSGSGVSPTEDLAQYISSRLLFLDSIQSGYDRNSLPITHYSGGYFEWHKIGLDGVQNSPPHIDFNVRLEDKGLFISRIYFSESMYRPDGQGNQLPMRSVISLTEREVAIKTDQFDGGRIKISFEFAKGAFLHQALSESQDVKNPDGSRDIAGRLEKEHLRKLFEKPVNIHSARTFFIIRKSDTSGVEARSHIIADKRASNQLASMTFDGSFLVLEFDGNLLDL